MLLAKLGSEGGSGEIIRRHAATKVGEKGNLIVGQECSIAAVKPAYLTSFLHNSCQTCIIDREGEIFSK